ncbi:hypothetical protein EDD18DRAFT_1114313 [Armillaria luteobubalina]|uniref:Uncharacterized protein n=1 Tax=Armillaria luteobubalina TaxID=153913 RepID=A0AA39P681_9AGAR|nr:hypothetical protein EDD18DRAFT_1114313 [Armillaria luteobubalina]
MSQFSRPDFILYHITPHLYNPKKLPAKALKKLDLPTKRKKFFHRTMSSPSLSHGSHTAFSGSGPSSPEYSSGSDMNIDSPPAALRAVIAPPGPSGGPSTPSRSQRSAPSVALQFAPQEGSPPPPANNATDLLSALPIGKDHGAAPSSAPAPAPAPAPTPILPPNPAAGPAPHISSIAMNLIVDGIITGVVKGLAPFFDRLTAILLQIQQEAAEARQEEKARREAKEKAREAERQ